VSRVRAPSRRSWYVRRGKRALDLGLGGLLLALSAPVQLAVAAVVRARLGRPVLLRQPRLGEGGRPFVILKFRTMKPDRRVTESVVPLAEERRSGHPSYDDPRHTRIGTILRRWSLDELPQLVNVVRGEMSLVGPRPDMASAVARYEPWQLERHTVKPGLTGVWQVEQRHERGELREFAAVDIDLVAEERREERAAEAEAEAAANEMNGTATRPTDHVEVQCRIEGQWIDGFEVFEIIQDGGLRRYRLRRLSDGVVMPVQYAARDVRRKTVAAGPRYLRARSPWSRS